MVHLNEMKEEYCNRTSEIPVISGKLCLLFSRLYPDPIGQMLGSEYYRFDAIQQGVSGLCFIEGDTINILAVSSYYERRGNVRSFFAELKLHYKVIKVESICNRTLKSALERWGFKITKSNAEWTDN